MLENECKHKNTKSCPSLKAHWATLISVSLALSLTPVFTLKDHRYGASASRGVPHYIPAFADTRCAYPRRMKMITSGISPDMQNLEKIH